MPKLSGVRGRHPFLRPVLSKEAAIPFLDKQPLKSLTPTQPHESPSRADSMVLQVEFHILRAGKVQHLQDCVPLMGEVRVVPLAGAEHIHLPFRPPQLPLRMAPQPLESDRDDHIRTPAVPAFDQKFPSRHLSPGQAPVVRRCFRDCPVAIAFHGSPPLQFLFLGGAAGDPTGSASAIQF